MTAADAMVPIPGGELLMGSERFYPEERPIHPVAVAPFSIDRHPVTHAAFAEFVAATGYVTVAERPLDPAHFPGAPPDALVPGGLVFIPPPGPVSLNDWTRWWAYVPGASWRAPYGPDADLGPLEDHPVTQVAFEDTEAFAAWRGVRLPTEAEWELAARGGLVGAEFAWGDEPYPDGRQLANTFQGSFPWRNSALDGFVATSPVGSFPPNGHGLHNATGNDVTPCVNKASPARETMPGMPLPSLPPPTSRRGKQWKMRRAKSPATFSRIRKRLTTFSPTCAATRWTRWAWGRRAAWTAVVVTGRRTRRCACRCRADWTRRP